MTFNTNSKKCYIHGMHNKFSQIIYQVKKFRDQRKGCQSLNCWIYIIKKNVFRKNFFFLFKKSENRQSFLSRLFLISRILDLISYFAWTKVYRENNHHIDHMVRLIHGLKAMYDVTDPNFTVTFYCPHFHINWVLKILIKYLN